MADVVTQTLRRDLIRRIGGEPGHVRRLPNGHRVFRHDLPTEGYRHGPHTCAHEPTLYRRSDGRDLGWVAYCPETGETWVLWYG